MLLPVHDQELISRFGTVILTTWRSIRLLIRWICVKCALDYRQIQRIKWDDLDFPEEDMTVLM